MIFRIIKKQTTLFYLLIFVLICLFYLTENLLTLPNARYSDIEISHLPNALFIIKTWIEDGQIPLWANNILSGYPFSSNPLSGLWYFPGWGALLFPLPLGFNVMIIMHLLLGGWGMYRFLQFEGFHKTSIVVGVAAFTLMPKVYVHYAAGHLSLVYGIMLTPWLLYFERLRYRNSKALFSPIAGLIYGLMILADIRWAYYGGLLWLFIGLSGYIQSVVDKSDLPEKGIQGKSMILYGSSFLFQLFIAMLIGSPIILPLYQYTAFSTRSLLTLADRLVYSLPPIKLIGFLIPSGVGNIEWYLYSGYGVLLLSMFLVLIPSQVKKQWIWMLIFLVSVGLSLGSNIPVIKMVFDLPILNLLRVPSRFLFLACFCLAYLSTAGMDLLLKDENIQLRQKKNINLFVFGVSIFVILSFFMIIGKDAISQYLYLFVTIILLPVMIVFHNRESKYPQLTIGGILFLIIMDLFMTNFVNVDRRPLERITGDRFKVLMDVIKEEEDLFRVYTPSYSISQYAGVKLGLEFANGIDPMQLKSYVEYFEDASGVPVDGYSVTIPPFRTGDPAIDNIEYSPDSQQLGYLNVKYVLSDYQISAAGLSYVTEVDDLWIYENEEVYPRAWIQKNDCEFGDCLISIPQIRKTANQILVYPKGQMGLLILSEIYYPGWVVRVDGEKQSPQKVGEVFIGVDLGDSTNEVVFEYCPYSVFSGVILSCLGWIIVIILGVSKLRHFFMRTEI